MVAIFDEGGGVKNLVFSLILAAKIYIFIYIVKNAYIFKIQMAASYF